MRPLFCFLISLGSSVMPSCHVAIYSRTNWRACSLVMCFICCLIKLISSFSRLMPSFAQCSVKVTNQASKTLHIPYMIIKFASCRYKFIASCLFCGLRSPKRFVTLFKSSFIKIKISLKVRAITGFSAFSDK